ncbi:hypothetical protein [Candidatus Tisiphia endosymbiont of Mystacides longicornis]|uniref:hypothetical protein n=1 Tax=Candidatus Tisiphia endosymbiont of Mystacides longicornis TaxID=3139330 RepID=UPI003CCA9818
MAKQIKDSYSYIDLDKTLLRTANNLYENALTQIARAETIQKECGLPKVKKLYQMVSNDLRKALLFGKAESAAALAYLHREGLGVEKNEYKDKLLVAVRAKLGDPTCLNILQKDTTRIYKDVFLEAEQWVKAINVITTKYTNKDAEIAVSAAVWADGQLESHCKQFQSEIKKFAKLAKENRTNSTYQNNTTNVKNIKKSPKSYSR